MWIINNQYHSIFWPSTSIPHWSLGLNASIHLLMIFCRILFHPLTMASFKESRSVIFQPWYTFYCRNPQIPISTGFKSGLFGGQWWNSSNLSCFLSFKISRLSLVVWALAMSWMNKYSFCFTSLFISERFSSIVHYNNNLLVPLHSAQQNNWSFTSFQYFNRNLYLLGKGFNFAE